MQAARHLSAPFVTGMAFLAMVAASPRVREAVGPTPAHRHATAAPASGAAAPASAGFVVIVNAGNPATTLSKLDASRIFLKKARAWPGGGLSADPVDQKDASPARREFLSAVMGKDPAAMAAYWQSQLFVGRTTPPPVKGSDADVIAFVAGSKGAIGYVSAGIPLPETVKAIRIGE